MAATTQSQSRPNCLFIFRFLFLHGLFQTLYSIVGGVEGHAQAFIQTDNELQYLVDGVSIQMHHQGLVAENSVSFSDTGHEHIESYTNIISFHPPFLDFKIQPVGIPYIKKVVAHNPSTVSSINMLSISGSTVHFHCSFFLEKIIEPGGNTTFDVVFLSRERGPIENTLFIHTSVGSFAYKVQGEGAPNPYRLRPFLGVRVPLNSSYNPLINMHNPYGDTLQVTEMYSSGGDLHLELVNGEAEAPANLWAIQPYETKSVMRASFIARKESNHTAYIRIKTNSSGEPYLVIPVEVEVSSEPGIYSPVEVLDFGVIRSDDEEIKLTLNLLNSGKKPIQITNVIATPVNEALKIEFKALKILPDTFHSSEVAKLTFTPSKVQNMKQCSGKIVVKSKNNQFKLSVPYLVHLLHGSLHYNKSALQFYINPSNTVYSRILNVTNMFNATIVIFNITLSVEAQPYFTVLNFTRTILKPGQSARMLTLEFNTDVKDLQLSSYLKVHTNISYFNFPLICYTGKLDVLLLQTNEKNGLEFGTLGMGEKRVITFRLHNNNKVQVKVNGWSTNMTKTIIKCFSIQKNTSSYKNISDTNKTVLLEPSDIAIFLVEVTAPSEEGRYFGLTIIKTIYEVIKIPFTFTAAEGSLNSVPEIIEFDNTFPGKVSHQSLHIQSTFSQPMKISDITTVPFDPRFYFQPSKSSGGILKPESKTNIGKLYFDLRKSCKIDCYVVLPTNTAKGHKWLSGISLPSDVGQIDKEIYDSLKAAWDAIKSSQSDSINVTLQLDTEDVQGFLLQTRARLKWPQLSVKRKLKFPLTQIGNISVKELLLENPGSLPLLVQVVTLPVYPNQQIALDLLNHVALDHMSDVIETENSDLFFLMDLEKYEKSKDVPTSSYRSTVESYFGVKSHKESIVILLTPGMKVKLQVGFAPTDERLRSSLILIRNNLTVLDTVVVEGQGGYGEMRLGNKEPSLKSSLLLEMTEKHLADCDRENNQAKIFPSRFTVKRSFTARNTGKLPIYISNFYISNSPCQGYGFRILNCNSFHLQPNASYKLDVAFTPDFTLTRIDRVLSIETSLSLHGEHLNYSLVATVPANMLDACAQALPRSQWEAFLYYSVVCFMIFLLFCIFATAYFESDRILRSTYVAMAITSPVMNNDHGMEKSRVFDLKTLGSKSFSSKTDSPKKTEKSKTAADKKDKIESSYKFPMNLLFRKRSKSPKFSEVFSKATENGIHNSAVGNNDISESLSPNLGNGDVSEPSKCISNYKKKTLKEGDVHYTLDTAACPKDEGSQKSSSFKSSWGNIFKSSNSKNLNSIEEDACVKNSVSSKTHKNDENKEESEDYYSPNQIIEIMDKDTRSKWSTKMKNKKKNVKNNSSLPENDLIKTLVKKSHSYEEETSSTTTETSNPDSDNSAEKELKIMEKVRTKCKLSNKTHTVLNKYENKTVSVRGVDDDGENTAEFELSTKSKAHKKIKIDSSKVYGGDILKPSTLELPYKLKPVKLDKEGKENKHHKVRDATSQKSSSKNKSKANTNDSNGLSSSSSRSSSYSSIVSSNGEAKVIKLNKKCESKHPGPIGQKPSSGLTSNPWTIPEPSPTNSGVPSSSDTLDSFFLPPIQENNASSRDSAGIPPLSTFNFGSDINYSQAESYPTFNPPSVSPWEGLRSKPMTMMQTLQAERRQRMEDYRKQQSFKTDWPGFESNVNDNLWDTSFHLTQNEAPVDTWSSSPMVSQPDSRNEGLWNSLKGSTWNSVSNFWPSSNEAKSNLMDTTKLRPDEEEKRAGFDPFHNLSSIWSPGHSQANGVPASTENAWSNSFFTENNHSDNE